MSLRVRKICTSLLSVNTHAHTHTNALSHTTTADSYLLQIQPYNFATTHKPKTEGTAIKADSDQSESGNVVAPATGQKEAPPQWYDVEMVKGTQFTVTGYNIPSSEQPASQPAVSTLSHTLTQLI